MPILSLMVVAVVGGSLAALLAYRLAGPAPAAPLVPDAIDEVLDRAARLGRWRRARFDPSMLTGLALTLALLATIGGGLLIALLAYLARTNATLLSLDAGAATWGSAHATHLSTRLLHLVTDLGDVPVVPLLAVVVALVELRWRASRLVVPFLIVVLLGDQLITQAIKAAVDRSRPTIDASAAALGPSFPSGHSSTAAALYAALALLLARGRGRRARALLVGSAVGLALAVAASRVLLDVHWLSDVVAGVLLGWAWFSLCAIVFGSRVLRVRAPGTTTPDGASGRCGAIGEV